MIHILIKKTLSEGNRRIVDYFNLNAENFRDKGISIKIIIVRKDNISKFKNLIKGLPVLVDFERNMLIEDISKMFAHLENTLNKNTPKSASKSKSEGSRSLEDYYAKEMNKDQMDKDKNNIHEEPIKNLQEKLDAHRKEMMPSRKGTSRPSGRSNRNKSIGDITGDADLDRIRGMFEKTDTGTKKISDYKSGHDITDIYLSKLEVSS